MFNHLKAVFPVLFLGVCTPAIAADFSMGIGGAWQSSPYKGHDDDILPVPLIHLEAEPFYIHGTEAGFHLWQNKYMFFLLGFPMAVSLSMQVTQTTGG